MRGVLHLCACALLVVLVTLPTTRGQLDSRCNNFRTPNLEPPVTCTSNCGNVFGACQRVGTICCPLGVSGRCSYCVSAPATCPSITTVANGVVVETTVNDQRRLTFTCNSGFRLVGIPVLTCTGTTWSGAFPTCESVVTGNCPSLGTQANRLLSTTAVFNGVVVTVLCTGGTQLPNGGVFTTITCNQGAWSQNPLPSCQQVSTGVCPSLTITNGLVSSSNVNNGAIITVFCRTGFVLNGQNTIICANGVWSPPPPTCQRIVAPTCPLITIPNGFLSNQNVSEGAIVTVVCQPGFSLGTQSATIRCSQGNWLPAIPTCQRTSCPPLVIPNAVFSPTTTTVNTQVQVRCNAGFTLVGSSVITCSLAGSWTPSIPVCRAVFCTPLTAPANGVITSGTGASTVNSVTTFACSSGFQLAGSSRRTCQPNGVWDGVPAVCNRIVVRCSIPGPPANGQRSVTGDGSVGTVVAFTCNQGYVLRGAGVVRCLGNGQFDQSFPVCVRAFCGEAPTPTNGQKNVTGQLAPGQAVQFSCAAGYRLQGSPVLVCLTNGAYDRQAPTCQRVTQCPVLSTQANRQDRYTSDRLVNSFVQFTCASGFFLDGSSSLRCQSNGQWDGGPPSCRVLSCPAVPGINNGRALTSDNRINAQVSYQCDSGYVLSFSEPLRCVQPAPNQQPRWDRNPPVCTLSACGPPPSIQFGSPINPNDRRVGAQVRYQCQGGYQLSENIVLTCRIQQNGQPNWDRSPPQCQRQSCSAPPSVSNGGPSTNGNFIGAVATYSCNQGYTLSGNTRLVCRDFGQGQAPRWDGLPPTCSVRDCGPLPNLADAAAWPPGLNTAIGASHSVPCDAGFTPNRVTATCSAAGRWEYSQGCTAVRCQAVGPPRFGRISSSDNTVGSTIQVTCNAGYQISGPGLLTCRVTGNGAIYTPNVPTCNPITCIALMAPRFGSVDIQGPRNPNSVARYSCDRGYNLDGPSQVTCRTNGMWSSNAPICVPVNCGNELPPSANIVRRPINNIDTSYGATLSAPCQNGFMPDAIVFVCSQRAQWESAGRCIAAPRCPTFHSSSNMGMTVDVNSLSFRCNTGFTIQGPQNITCINGVWSSLPPVCIPVPGSCNFPNTPQNGLRPVAISGTEGSANAAYRFACFPGYEINGASVIRCLGNGNFDQNIPTCRRVLRCEQQFRDPVNGRVMYTTDRGTGEPRADFTCDTSSGYSLSGSPSLFCRNGQWSGVAPTCVRSQQCATLNIPGIDIRYTRNAAGQLVATFTCVDTRLEAVPFSTVCRDNRVWDNPNPQCRSRAAQTCPALSVSNGQVEYYEGSQQVGAQNGQLRTNTIARVRCATGSNPNGDSQLTCQSNGQWTGRVPNACTAAPPTQCPGLPNVSNGRFVVTPDRTRASLTCNPGYTPNGPTDFTCQSNRVWNPTPNTQCNPAPSENICGVLNLNTAEFRDLRYTMQGRLGSVATYACVRSGYVPQPDRVTCESSRQWSAQPRCVPTGGPAATCLAFGVSGASVSYFNGAAPVNARPNVDRVPVGTRAVVNCDGSLDGDREVICQANGQFSGRTATRCSPVPAAGCVVFAIQSGATQYLQGANVINPSVGARVQVGTTVRVQCQTGTTLQGDALLTCQSNGFWNGNQALPVCTGAGPAPPTGQCSAINVQNGRATYTNFGSPGSIATVICNNGPGSTSSCVGGRWDPAPIERCQPVSRP